METSADTAIIGAGITGLCAAYSLHQHGRTVQLFEKNSCAGGAIQSHQDGGYLSESGPNSLLIKDKRVADLLENLKKNSKELGMMDAREEAKKRYIAHGGRPHAMPSSPLGMIQTPLFSSFGKLRFALEPFIGRYKGIKQGKGEESFADFVRRRLGPDMLASAAGPFVSGIYAGDPENLSVRHAFPRLWNLEHNYGSFILGAVALQFGWGKQGRNPNRHSPAEMISFSKGMQELPNAIAQQLPQSSIQYDSKLTVIKPLNLPNTNGKPGSGGWQLSWLDSLGKLHSGQYRQLIIASPHHQLSKLPLPDSIQKELTPAQTLASPPVTSLVLGFKKEDISHPLDGFGMLIKQSEQSPLLGVLFSSSMFAGRAPEGHVTLTCMMGGSLNPHFAQNSEQQVLEELHRLLGVSGPPTYRRRSEWTHAIPQYGLDYQQVLDAIELCESLHPNLHLAGNYRGGISVGDCIVNGLELGTRLSPT